ncbi:MAG: ferritin family protein [Gemmatimonadales bacterium]
MEAVTRRHLEDALCGEAMAALRYALFADRAREDGFDDIAELFREIGDEERREHYREIAELLDLVGTTPQNLESSLAGEVTEHRRLYPQYAGEARQAGDEAIAEQFIELGEDEHRHAERLRGALAATEALAGAGRTG